VKQGSVGLLRVMVKAVQDEKEGYVTMESNAGKTYLNCYDSIMTVEAEVQQALQELLEMCAKASKYIEAKRKELKSVREGPLAETRTALQAMETLVRNVQQERKKLKKCIAETKEKQMLAIKNEKRKKQEAIEQEEADRVLDEAMKPATEAAEQLETAVAAAQVLAASRGKTTENPLQAMDEAEEALNSSLNQVEAALTVIKQFMYYMKNAGKGPLAETRSALAKLNIKVGAFETKGKKQLAALAGARKQVTQDAEEVLQEALRHHAISQAWQPCELFKRL
jgi:chromosome segregation ATPase